MSFPGFAIGIINDDFHIAGIREVEEGCDVFNRPRSEMLQLEDAELVGAKGLSISTALDCIHY